jgi:hypothetical protein
MSKYFSPFYLKIDLRICKSAADFERLRDDNNIPVKELSGRKMMELKKTIDIIFYDTQTFCIAAYVSKGEKTVTFVNEFPEFLLSLPALSFVDTFDFSDLEMDIVLDKISASGMNSLSKKEKAFLESHSKK